MLLFPFNHGKFIHRLSIVDEDKWGKAGFLKGDHNQNFRMVLSGKFELLKEVKQSF